MTREEKIAVALIAAVIAGLLLAAYTPAAGLNDFTHRYIVDADGTWYRVSVPATAEFVRLAEDGRYYRLHKADHSIVQWPTPGWTVYDGRTGQTTVLTSVPSGALP